jgi:hypothetical protein
MLPTRDGRSPVSFKSYKRNLKDRPEFKLIPYFEKDGIGLFQSLTGSLQRAVSFNHLDFLAGEFIIKSIQVSCTNPILIYNWIC